MLVVEAGRESPAIEVARGRGIAILELHIDDASPAGVFRLGAGAAAATVPDFAGPDFVKEAAAAAIAADMNQYAPSHGTPRLRNAIAAEWAARYGRDVDPDVYCR